MKGQKRYRFGAIKPIPKRKRSKYGQSGSGRIPRNIGVASGQRSIVPITRMCTLAGLSGASNVDDVAAYSFQLSDLPGYTQFTALYDQYRFLAVKVEFVPTNAYGPYVVAAAGVQTQAPTLMTCIDLDDAVTPTANIVESHETAKMHGSLNCACVPKYVRWVEPAIAMENYQTGGFGGYTSKTKQWCDSASPSVQHYGLKCWVSTQANSLAYSVDVFATYYLEFRMPF